MEEYISKSALVAEIEKRISSLESIGSENYLHDNYPEQYAMLMTLKSLKFSIDTLEVKEVDSDNECRKYLTEHFNVYEDGILQSKRSGMPLDTFDVIQVASHFFELGLKAKVK